MLLGNSEFSWTWETMQSSWQLHKLISLPWEQPAFPTLLSCLLAKASSLCSLIIAAMSRRGLSFSILSLSHQQNLPLLQKATVHYFSQKWRKYTSLQNVFLPVLCHLLLLKCCICVFPLNEMRLNVLEFKPEMAEMHTAFYKYDKLGSYKECPSWLLGQRVPLNLYFQVCKCMYLISFKALATSRIAFMIQRSEILFTQHSGWY